MKIKTRLTIGAIAFVAAIFAAPLVNAPAYAQTVCTDRKGAGNKLSSVHSEARVNMGLAGNGHVIEVFASEDGSTFTLIITSPNGITCLMAAGQHWESFPWKLKKDIRYGDQL